MKCVTPVDSVSCSSVSCERKGASLLDVTFYGVRGSTPTACERTRRYGGNTACVALQVPDEPPIAARPGHGPALLRRDPARRRQLPWLGPRLAPPLGPRAGAAVLRAHPAAGRLVRRLRARPGGRPQRGRGVRLLHAGAVLPGDGGRPAGRDPLPRPRRGPGEGRGRPRDRAGHPPRRAHVRLPDRVGRGVGRLPPRPPAARPTAASTCATPPSSWPTASTCSSTTPSTPSAEFAKKSTWGHCTYEYAMWVAQAGRGRRRWRCSTTTRSAPTTRSTRCCGAARRSPTAPASSVVAAAEGQRIRLGEA